MRCRKCHYQLNDLTEPRCPECGTEFDPDDSRSYLSERKRIPWPVQVLVALIVATFFWIGLGMTFDPFNSDFGILVMFISITIGGWLLWHIRDVRYKD